ncbi:hypothetical protein AMAG_20535 [Allomyces macrogynus ATCC 38327]|uniref:Association with the SNF1 complex (ASC) domain-containing protein n=1 Tax=Allomyces macrogynus (strain ATCC 38327) TaxID=578462 RepID=A0A0L0TDB4_ALLM3|nr:hypothetical protein AMAG_20535 [Allomyces macrogynus ATCC 38327]|eukprot:KNE72534.1 hypothetical protein AMAG_20535 [Allomyces macrogynus ATCC 38327]
MGNTPSTPSAVEPALGTIDQVLATAAAANAARQDASVADRPDTTATTSAAAAPSSPARARHAHQLATLEQSQDAHLGARRPVPLVLSGKPAPTAPIALPSPRHAAHHQYGAGFMDRDHGHAHGADAESTGEPSPTAPHSAGAAAARNPALSAAVAAAAAQFGISPFDLVDDDGTDVDENAPVLDPPSLPVHLTKVVLNQARPDEEVVPVPPHVVLNHLYACSIRDGVMAVAITSRYRKKHVTTVYYRPVSI